MKITTEQKILLKILKGDPSIKLEEADPDRLFNLFQRHRLLPLASDIIGQLDESNRERWKKAIQLRAIKSLHLTNVLQKVILELADNSIATIPLKGPALSFRLYGEIDQRHIRDLDLYVEKENIFRAVEVLEGMGFEAYTPKGILSEKQWKYYFNYKYDIGLINKNLKVILELHSGFLYPKLFDKSEDGLIKELEVEHIAGAGIRCLKKDSSFLYLAIHGSHHLFFRLFWLRDIAAALNSWDLDHQRILENAKHLGMERLLGVTLLLVKEYFDINVPEEYQKYLKNDSKILYRLRHLSKRAINGNEFPSFRGRLERFFFYMSLKPGFKYKWVTMTSVYHRWYIRRFLDI